MASSSTLTTLGTERIAARPRSVQPCSGMSSSEALCAVSAGPTRSAAVVAGSGRTHHAGTGGAAPPPRSLGESRSYLRREARVLGESTSRTAGGCETAACARRTPVRGALPRLHDPASPSLHVGRTPRPRASFLPIPVRTCTSRPQVAFETILIEIYRIVTRKTLEAGGEGPKPGGETTKIVLDKVGSKKKGGCC